VPEKDHNFNVLLRFLDLRGEMDNALPGSSVIGGEPPDRRSTASVFSADARKPSSTKKNPCYQLFTSFS